MTAQLRALLLAQLARLDRLRDRANLVHLTQSFKCIQTHISFGFNTAENDTYQICPIEQCSSQHPPDSWYAYHTLDVWVAYRCTCICALVQYQFSEESLRM